ncbi:MAG: GIY-YIG nuclease family protein [Bacteroidetes bacterium]|jgi:predicted GIY-YIG superfamily endonuclease|nr:GIY-YIG nuclease family protein [Bacteroidota bacterium]
MSPKPQFIVYTLRCSDNTYYVGRTKDLQDRLERHNKKQVAYTAIRLPFELITYRVFFNEYKAVCFEKYLKTGSGRAFAKRHFY